MKECTCLDYIDFLVEFGCYGRQSPWLLSEYSKELSLHRSDGSLPVTSGRHAPGGCAGTEGAEVIRLNVKCSYQQRCSISAVTRKLCCTAQAHYSQCIALNISLCRGVRAGSRDTCCFSWMSSDSFSSVC